LVRQFRGFGRYRAHQKRAPHSGSGSKNGTGSDSSIPRSRHPVVGSRRNVETGGAGGGSGRVGGRPEMAVRAKALAVKGNGGGVLGHAAKMPAAVAGELCDVAPVLAAVEPTLLSAGGTLLSMRWPYSCLASVF
jgi:hypothetical protein